MRLLPESDRAATPFNLTGAPAVWFLDDYSKIPIHTTRDTIDLLSPERMASAIAMAATVLERLLDGGPTDAG